jgi:uncharacterized protein (TIGR03067 family)
VHDPEQTPKGQSMDLELMQGTWRAVRIETGGRPVPNELARSVRYTFEGDRVRLAEGDQPAGKGVIALDPVADPKAFDFSATDGPQAGTVARGIYRIEDDRLTMCLGRERPAGFTGAGEAALVELEHEA